MMLGCEPVIQVDGTINGQTVTLGSGWWTQYVSPDGTEQPQYYLTLSTMEDGCQALLDYQADLEALNDRYDAEEISAEEFVAEAEETFAAHLPSDIWQVVIEFLVQEGAYTELRLTGSDWDRYPQTNEIAANFVHQTGLRYAGADRTTRYISHLGSAEITYDLDRQTFEGEFTTSVTDYSTGQIFEEVTILWEVNFCEGLAFDEAVVWW
jgi:hypothetical protein